MRYEKMGVRDLGEMQGMLYGAIMAIDHVSQMFEEAGDEKRTAILRGCEQALNGFAYLKNDALGYLNARSLTKMEKEQQEKLRKGSKKKH